MRNGFPEDSFSRRPSTVNTSSAVLCRVGNFSKTSLPAEKITTPQSSEKSAKNHMTRPWPNRKQEANCHAKDNEGKLFPAPGTREGKTQRVSPGLRPDLAQDRPLASRTGFPSPDLPAWTVRVCFFPRPRQPLSRSGNSKKTDTKLHNNRFLQQENEEIEGIWAFFPGRKVFPVGLAPGGKTVYVCSFLYGDNSHLLIFIS